MAKNPQLNRTFEQLQIRGSDGKSGYRMTWSNGTSAQIKPEVIIRNALSDIHSYFFFHHDAKDRC